MEITASYTDVIFWSLVGGLFSISAGAILLANKKFAQKIGVTLTPFAAGALLAAAFLDLLPEALEITGNNAAFRWAIAGILIFFLLEQYLHWFHHHHEHEGKEYKKPTASLIIIGDTLHNAIDGVAIGAAFVINPAVGIITALAVAAHEIPQEIGDFSILLKSGMRRGKVLFWNAVSSLSTVIAAVYTFYLGNQESLPLGPILGLSAGLFIYIAASDLIPTIHEESKGKFAKLPALLIILGVLTVGLLTEIAHEKIHESTHDHEQTHQESSDRHNNVHDEDDHNKEHEHRDHSEEHTHEELHRSE